LLIIVFTGDGKGKTTAAIGQAIRAVGNKKKIIIIQFIKGPWKSGEDKFIKSLNNKNLKILKGGKGFVGILGDKLPLKEHKKAAQRTLKLAKQIILDKKYNLIVLDEINTAVNLKLIPKKEIVSILKKAANEIDIILTGRSAPKEFINLADIASEMRELKFNYRKAKIGLEY